MEKTQIFPQIVNVTDLRYRWSKVAKKLEESKLPILIIEYSTPKAVLLPFSDLTKDPLEKWREKYARQFADWNATAAIRKARNSRWNLS